MIWLNYFFIAHGFNRGRNNNKKRQKIVWLFNFSTTTVETVG